MERDEHALEKTSISKRVLLYTLGRNIIDINKFIRHQLNTVGEIILQYGYTQVMETNFVHGGSFDIHIILLVTVIRRTGFIFW